MHVPRGGRPRGQTSRIILIESDDRGRSWTNRRQLDDRLTFAEDLAVWNAPRIVLLPDGRLVANIDAFVFPDDADDWNLPQSLLSSQTFLWFSEDEGQTWTERNLTEVQGFCTDRILALTADHWLTAVAFWSIRFPGAFRLHTVHSVGRRPHLAAQRAHSRTGMAISMTSRRSSACRMDGCCA